MSKTQLGGASRALVMPASLLIGLLNVNNLSRDSYGFIRQLFCCCCLKKAIQQRINLLRLLFFDQT